MHGHDSRLILAFVALLAASSVQAGLVHSPNAASDDQRPAQDVSPAKPSTAYFRQLGVAFALVAREDHSAADPALAEIIASPMFEGLSVSLQRASLAAAGWVAIQREDFERSRDLYRRATEIDPSESDDWYRLSLLERALGEVEQSANDLSRLARDWPESLGGIDETHILGVLRDIDPNSQARLDLLQSLFDAGWTLPGLGASQLWYELAVLRVQRGEMDLARAAVKGVVSPIELVKLRSDKRFDPLVDAGKPDFDVELAARRQVDDLRAQAGRDPTSLDIQVDLSYAMLFAGMHQKVVDTADEILSAIAAAPAGEAPYRDLDMQLWIMNNRAIALRRLGRIDEALTQLERASRMTEEGRPNVNQALNLGWFYASLGRPEDALAAIAQVDDMSAYGRMVQASVRMTAALQMGDDSGAQSALAYMRENREDSQLILLVALVEADAMDEAACVATELLASPSHRGDILLRLQQFRQPDPLPGDEEARARWRALVARPDVQSAVAAVGRIQRYGIYGKPDTD